MVETAVVAEPSVPPGNRVLILEADVQFAQLYPPIVPLDAVPVQTGCPKPFVRS